MRWNKPNQPTSGGDRKEISMVLIVDFVAGTHSYVFVGLNGKGIKFGQDCKMAYANPRRGRLGDLT